MITINFNYLDVSSTSFKNKKRLKAQLVSLFKKEGALVESMDYIFCTDAYLLGINKQFLKHNFYTDIITFNLANKKAPIQGEIYISIDRVKENAQMHQTTYKEELHRVIFHGALHLCGYKDKLPGHVKKMRKAEDSYLASYFK